VIAATQPVDVACPSPRPMPVIFFQGTADKFVPFNGGPIAPQLGKNRGTAMSNAEAVEIWQKRNGCGAPTRTQLPDTVPLPVTVETFSCPPGHGLEDVIVQGGGHTWPGARQGLLINMILGPVTDSINANEMMWTFFQKQML
jgi:polyhydroxybutyrate depolymerase